MKYLEGIYFCVWLKANSWWADPELCPLSAPRCPPVGLGWGESPVTPVVPALWNCSLPPALSSAKSQSPRSAAGEDKNISFALNHLCRSSIHPTQMVDAELDAFQAQGLRTVSAVPLSCGPAPRCIPKLIPSDGERSPNLNPNPCVVFGTRLGV